MSKFLRSLTFLITLVSLFGIFSSPSKAQEFAFDYDVYYKIRNTGITEVKTYVTITNKYTDYFARNFVLTLSSQRIEKVYANDDIGSIPVTITKDNDQSVITVTFSRITPGINKRYNFLLSYESNDIANKKGRIWEIIIPGIEKSDSINTYNIHLSVPEEFGSPKYLSPVPRNSNTWVLDEIVNHGITAAYGEYQIFKFKLQYHLTNSTGKNEIQVISIPPDTAWQKIIINQISQLPENVTVDGDGNWLAEYKLAAATKKDINLEGYAYIYSDPRPDFVPAGLNSVNNYLSQQDYWEITSAMKSKAEDLASTENIYLFVKDYLTYDFNRAKLELNRLGAKKVFENPKVANCMEFTDLFVALARAAGIPSRAINGYAYTTNSRIQPFSLSNDILHAWPEYYDKKTKIWMQIDPTWGNTTHGVDYFHQFDFNHFAFAIMGINSDYPYPAGAFKDNKPEKNVFIDLVTDDVTINQIPPEISFVPELAIWPDIKIHGKILIKNPGPVFLNIKNLHISGSTKITYLSQDISGIPPYGYYEIPVKFDPLLSLIPVKYNFQITFSGQDYHISTNVSLWKPYNLGLMSIGGLILFAIIISYVRFNQFKKTG